MDIREHAQRRTLSAKGCDCDRGAIDWERYANAKRARSRLDMELLDLLLVGELRALDESRTPEEMWKVLTGLEQLLPIRSTCPHIPYVIVPPTTEPPCRWPELLGALNIPQTLLRRLLHRSFMPFDTARFDQMTGGNSWLALLTNQPFVPVDLDYGVTPYAEDSPTWANALFGRGELDRYRAYYPELRQDSTLFFSLGAVRLRRVASDLFTSGLHSPITLAVESRAEWDGIIARLRERPLTSEGYQLWFRGQNSDHLVEDLTDDACRSICPWRSQADSSLIPSLYRKLAERVSDWKAYARLCREYALYSWFLARDINASPYTRRSTRETPHERLDEEWYRRFPQPTFFKTRDGASLLRVRRPGDEVAQELGDSVTEVRDYHPMFRGLQHVFFMQHYGLASPVLDITYSPDVALFFAQNSFADGTATPVDFEQKTPVIYVFLLRPDVDLFLNSRKLSEKFGLLRPLRQRCGLIFGASFVNQNDYARFIALKIVLRKPVTYNATPEHLIPPPTQDPFLQRLLQFSQEKDFQILKPWA